MDGLNEPNVDVPGRADGGDGGNPGGSVAPNKRQVEKALRKILESPHFRTSKQSQNLLSYVVRHSVAGQDNLLRERVIGSEVFGRAPDYDTANDPIVRARVAEVRKRLAQYYVSEDQRQLILKIEIPPGSYRAQFEVAAEREDSAQAAALTSSNAPEEELLPATATPAAPGGLRLGHNWWRWLAPGTLLIAGLLFWRFYPFYSTQEQALREFWSPAMNGSIPVLIYTGTNVVYRFSPEFLDRYRKVHRLPNTGPEFEVHLGPSEKVGADDLLTSSNSYVTVGDVSACAAIVAMLARHNKAYELRYAGDISAGDLRASPTVLIGAFNNPWTLNVTEPLHFAFVRGDTIIDRSDGKRSWSVRISPDGSTSDDYAVVTRMRNPKTGQLLLTAAGIGQYGTQAASEFLGSPQRIAEFATKAPRGWSSRNLQIVLHVKVADEVPSVVEIAAVYYW